MRIIVLLAVPGAIGLVHVLALLAGRRGQSRLHNLAFYSGLLGLLSIPAVLLTFLLAGPLPVVGPVNSGFAAAFNLIAVASLALAVTSAILAPYLAYKRAHPAA